MSWKGSPLKWLTYMTSINYIFVFFYFVSALIVSCLALFCDNSGKISHFEQPIVSSKEFAIEDVVNSNAETHHKNGFTVDSIISGIEENCMKRASLVSLRPKKSDQLKENVPTINKVHWLLSAIALNLSVDVTLIYWLLLFRYDNDISTNLGWFLNIDRHLLMLVWLIVDHAITKIPVRVLHFVYPSTVFVLYSIFNIIYTKITKLVIYPIMNFDKSPLETVGLVLAGSFLFVPIVHIFLYWAIYRLRERCS